MSDDGYWALFFIAYGLCMFGFGYWTGWGDAVACGVRKGGR